MMNSNEKAMPTSVIRQNPSVTSVSQARTPLKAKDIQNRQLKDKKKEQRLSKMFFFSIFLDILCVALVVPQMAHHMALLSSSTSASDIPNSNSTSPSSSSPVLFGLIQATYGIMQMISTPVMGALADTFGKKNILLMSVAGTSAAYFVLTVALWQRSMLLFFLSRAMVGAIRQTVSIASAYVSEVYGLVDEQRDAQSIEDEGVGEEGEGDEKDSEKQKDPTGENEEKTAGTKENTRNRQKSASPTLIASVSAGMSYLHASASLGFMVGPLLGGYVATVGGDLAPCVVSFLLDAINAVAMYVMLPNTKTTTNTSKAHDTAKNHAETRKGGETSSGEGKDQCDEKKNGGKVNVANKNVKPKPNPIRFIVDVLLGRDKQNIHPRARPLLIAMYLFSTANIALHSALSTIGKEIFAATPLQAGAMMSLSSGVAAIFLVFVMPKFVKLFSNSTIVIFTAAASFLFYVFQLLSPTLLSFTLVEVLVSVSNAANGAANKAKFSTLFPPERSGEAFAVIFSLDGINRVVLPISMGLLVQWMTDRANVIKTNAAAGREAASSDFDFPSPTFSSSSSDVFSSPATVVGNALLRIVATTSRAVCVSAEVIGDVVEGVSAVVSQTTPTTTQDAMNTAHFGPRVDGGVADGRGGRGRGDTTTWAQIIIAYLYDVRASLVLILPTSTLETVEYLFNDGPLKMFTFAFWETPSDLRRGVDGAWTRNNNSENDSKRFGANTKKKDGTQPTSAATAIVIAKPLMPSYCAAFIASATAASASSTSGGDVFSPRSAMEGQFSLQLPSVGIIAPAADTADNGQRGDVDDSIKKWSTSSLLSPQNPLRTILSKITFLGARAIWYTIHDDGSVVEHFVSDDNDDDEKKKEEDTSLPSPPPPPTLTQVALEQRQRISQVITVALSFFALLTMIYSSF